MLGTELDVGDIQRTWDLIAVPGHAIELRVLRRNGPPGIGRFTRSDVFERIVQLADAHADVTGIYTTLNPLSLDAPWRRPLNRLLVGGQGAKDADIAYRRWLLIDLDPRRPTKTNATASERQAAFTKAGEIGQALRRLGWADPVQATSGNGAHLLYHLSDWPNDAGSTDRVKRILHTLAARFSDARVDVDVSVFNASRISKVYGTIPKKGTPTLVRLWWPACLLVVPDPLRALTPDQAERIAIWQPAAPPEVSLHQTKRSQRMMGGLRTITDVQDYLVAWGIEQRSDPIPYGDGYKILVTCPWEVDHTSGVSRSESAVLWSGTGQVAYRCQHAHCTDKHWRDVRLWAKMTGTPHIERKD